jgi:hypothetical protein
MYHFGNYYRRLCCIFVCFCPNTEMSRLFHYEVCGIVTEGLCCICLICLCTIFGIVTEGLCCIYETFLCTIFGNLYTTSCSIVTEGCCCCAYLFVFALTRKWVGYSIMSFVVLLQEVCAAYTKLSYVPFGEIMHNLL